MNQGFQVKISDFAIFRPVFAGHYFHTTGNPGNNNRNSGIPNNPTAAGTAPLQPEQAQELLPLRWIPWEVYVMVRYKNTCLSNKVGNFPDLPFPGKRQKPEDPRNSQ